MSAAFLVLSDGTVYEGRPFGAEAPAFGEVVFNTSMSGYQEMLTDPSYAGQLVVPTYPLQGNYGINETDVESGRIQVAGFVVRDHSPTPSHYDATRTLHDYLVAEGIPGIWGVDTRAVTRRIRSSGVMMGALTVADPRDALRELAARPAYDSVNFVERVTAGVRLEVVLHGADAPDAPRQRPSGGGRTRRCRRARVERRGRAAHRRRELRGEAQHPPTARPARVPGPRAPGDRDGRRGARGGAGRRRLLPRGRAIRSTTARRSRRPGP